MKSKINKPILATTGLMAFTICTGLVLVEKTVSADDNVSSTASVSVASSCQMNAVINIPHTVEMAAGTYQSEIGKTTITTLCNDPSGYAVYTIGYSNTEIGRTDMLGANSGRVIGTGTATSGQTSNWAMKLTAVEGTYTPTILSDSGGSYASYHAVPDDFTKAVSYNSVTNVDPNGSKFETTYAIFVAGAQLPDTYTGKVKYTLVHPSNSTDSPCVGNYTIAYNANGGTGNMDSQTACVDRSISLLPNGFGAPAPASENQFAAWNTEADGSGYTYYPGQSVTNLASLGEAATLYAQWAPKYIQDLTPEICSVITSGRAYTVYDRRDGKDYTVRYINGACWMTQNLRITETINTRNSNFHTYEEFNPCVNDLSMGNTFNEARCHDSGNKTNGVWYNYASASAGTNYGGSDVSTNEDICPANWQLPIKDSNKPNNSIDKLVDGNSTVIIAAFSPTDGGIYTGGSLTDTHLGNYYTSTPYSAQGSYHLRYNANNNSLGITQDYVNWGSTAGKARGFYIRCVRASD